MTRHITSVLAGLLLAAGIVGAQTNPPPATPPPRTSEPERFLLVCDTSAGMKRRAKAVEDTAADLILSGMNGQLRPGDRVGVWTFNEQLYSGQFPVLTWTPETKQAAAARLIEFLKAQKYQKKATFSVVGQSLRPVLEKVERITVVLISDGATPVHGSRFDGQINNAFAEYQRSMKKPTAVLVTVLRARRGQLVASSVNVSPWPPEFPPFPPEPTPVAETKPATNALPKPPVKTAAPIILDMSKKPAPEPTPTNSLPQPADAITTNVVTESAAISGKPESAPKQEATESSANPATQPSQTAPAKTEVAQLTQSTQPDPSQKPTAPVAVVPVTPARTEPPPVEPHKAEVAAPAATVAAETQPVPVAIETPPVTSEPKATSPETSAPAQPIQTAVVTPSEPVVAGKRPLVVALGLLLAALVLVVIVFIRHRPQASSSLITRSMDRDEK